MGKDKWKMNSRKHLIYLKLVELMLKDNIIDKDMANKLKRKIHRDWDITDKQKNPFKKLDLSDDEKLVSSNEHSGE